VGRGGKVLEETPPAYSFRTFVLGIMRRQSSIGGTAPYRKMYALVGFLWELRLRLKV